MRKNSCVHFFEKYLDEISKGRGYREHKNPAVQFVKDAKSGKFDKVSDADYAILLRDTEDISAFWLDKPEQKASDILRVALENIDIDEYSLLKIATILSECYSSSVDSFAPEELNSDSDDSTDDFDFKEYFSEEMPTNERGLPFQETVKENITDMKLNSPKEIYDWLSNHIYGQEKAVKAAATLLYNHTQGRKRNFLFVGPTGCGKTEIWRACRQLYPYIYIIDSAIITGEGWAGSFKVNNIFDGMSQQEAEKAIIVFDEFDKLCEPQIGSGGTNHSLVAQNELLALIEGKTVRLKDYNIDTSKISFAFCGSFETLTQIKTAREAKQSIGFGANLEKKKAHLVYEDVWQPSDLVKYAGMRQEIAGRINQIVQLSPMTAEDYKEILNDNQISPLHQLERQYDVTLYLDTDTEQKLVQEAEETHMGVRYLRSRIQQMLDEQMFQDCDQTEYRLGSNP